jgi:hypothetical protein
MKKARTVTFALAAAVVFVSNLAIGAQVLPQGVRPGAPPRTADEAAYRQLSRQRAMDSANHAEMRRAEQTMQNSARIPREKFGRLTEKERKKIEAMRAPSAEDLTAHREFLLLPDTGIVRLLPGYNCESKYVVRVDGNCANTIMGASFHRFRKDSLSGDILFMDGDLIAEGFFSNSIMTGLGNIPIEQVSMNTTGMKYLNDFVPGTGFDAAKKQYGELYKGTILDGYPYANRLNAIPDMTYALRIIAYKNGNNVTKRLNRYALQGIEIPRDSMEMIFLALKDDNRTDLSVVFRIIRKDTDGSITLLWKKLAEKAPPEIVFPDDAALIDFK